MSYEEDYRRLYSAKCACGKGYLQFYRIYLSNDWGQEKENDTEVEIFCDSCKEKYHYERNYGDDYLVPNGLTFPQQRPELNEKYAYNSEEKIVKKYDRKRLITMMADMTAPAFQKFYDKMDGISIPQPFCQSFVPFAIVINKLLDKIPGFDKLNIDSEGLKKKFGLMGEPLFLGIVIGCGIGALGCGSWKEVVDSIPSILGLGIKMGAVMELIPRITSLFIEGLKPISDATRELIAKKYKNSAGLSIGMSPALVIGHPTTLVVSLLLIPVTIFLAVILPGNRFLPLASLAGMFYLFPMILPITKGNVVKSFIIGLVALIVGLYFVTELAGFFTLAAKDVYAATGDPTVNIPAGFEGGALDFASSLFCWGIFHLTYSLKIIGPAILVVLALGMAIYNRIRMTRNDAKEALNNK